MTSTARELENEIQRIRIELMRSADEEERADLNEELEALELQLEELES